MQNSGRKCYKSNYIFSRSKSVEYTILLIGWRGVAETGEQIKDEPQHVKQGEITLNLLKTLEIPYLIISKNIDYAKIQNLIFQSINSNKPVALVVKKDVFQEYNFSQNEIYNSLTREDAIKQILKFIPKNSIIVSTTGMTSRELYEIRDLRKENHDQDFLTIGGMGHASSIAIGIAKSKPNSEILCIDGDGSIIMHMGILPYIGLQKNIIHIVINNGSHDLLWTTTIATKLNLKNSSRM